MNFGQALEALKEGKKVARGGWNGKNMFLILVAGTPDCELREGTPYRKALSAAHSMATINPHIDMFTSEGRFQPGWLASQSDMLGEDWSIIE